jgi:hypothetical protein
LQVSILLPETDTTALKAIIKDSDYYSSETFRIGDVLTKSFIDGFLKTGRFYCSSENSAELSESFSIANNKVIVKLHKNSVYSSKSVELCKFKAKHLSDDEFQGEKSKLSTRSSTETFLLFQFMRSGYRRRTLKCRNFEPNCRN